MTMDPYKSGPFRHVGDMEDPLATIADLLRGIAIIAESLDEDVGSVVQRMAWLGLDQQKAAEKLRGELFHMTHPNPEHLAQEERLS
jgi:hypothetical protein